MIDFIGFLDLLFLLNVQYIIVLFDEPKRFGPAL